MNQRIFSLLVILLLVCVSNVFSADWKFYGGADIKKGDEIYVFYDSESIKISTNNNIMVWVKGVSYKSIDKILNNKHNKVIIDKAARKIADGYISPYSKITPEIEYKGNMNIIAWEEVANNSSTGVRLKAYHEIDCTENKIRTLSITIFKNGIVSKSSSNVGDWDFIAPDSNAELLGKILCEYRKSK